MSIRLINIYYSKINLLLSSFGGGGESGDDGDNGDGSYTGLKGDYMDEYVGDEYAHGHNDDEAEAPFVDFLAGYSFVDSSIFSLSS